MTFGPLRSLVLSLNQAAHGVAATVTRPAPDSTPISTTGIWAQTAPLEDAQPYGTMLQRRDPRRVMAIPRADVPTMPIGTTVVAPETIGGTNKTWRVESLERTEGDHWRVILRTAP